MSAPTKAQSLKEARNAGRQHAEYWQRETGTAQARTVAAWRAIGYANAVLQYEQTPYFMELLVDWEKGFDSTTGEGAGGTTPKAGVHVHGHEILENHATEVAVLPGRAILRTVGNPRFRNAERASYELGHLLMELPMNFGASAVDDDDHLNIAAAAGAHADNAGQSILNGIEAVGQLLEVAGGSAEEPLSQHTLLCLGDLLRHLAVEAQFLRETSENLAYCVSANDQRLAARQKGVKHVG